MRPANPLPASADRARHSRTMGFAAMCVVGFTLAAGSTVRVTAAPSDDRVSRLCTPSQDLREYHALRRMHAWSERLNQEAWMDANTTLRNGHFEYTIVSERGSDTIRNKVLRTMLQREQELVNSGDADKADLTEENYNFKQPETDGDGSTVVEIQARRKDMLLVNGQMVIDPASGELVRVEGRLAKNPSFWTTLVNVVRRYARIGGVRVPVATESTAKIRFAGTSQLEVRYEYQSINGQRVGLTAGRR
jgi:hypothetical protein